MSLPTVAMASILGGHVRVGLEDNLYIRKGEFATSNAALVERAVQILDSAGSKPAPHPQRPPGDAGASVRP